MRYKDYYQILGVNKSASADEIKTAYRKLAKKFHPDVSKEVNAEEKFKELGEAYEVLKDVEKRAAYDQLGSYRPGQDFRPPPGWEQRFRHNQGPGHAAGVDFGDLSDMFADLFGGANAGRRGPMSRRGEDVEAVVHITLQQAFHGTEIQIELNSNEMGPDGVRRRVPQEIKVKVPPGMTDGQKMRVAGKGGKGVGGAPDGDLILNIRLQPHALFRVEGHDLYIEVPVTPWEAALGGEIEVPTMQGSVRMRLKPGSRAGQKLRLSGKGMPRQRHGQGDLFVVLQVVVPSELTEVEARLFEELARVSSFNPRAHFG